MATDDGLFPPGDLLSEELAERGWSVEQFAEVSGLTPELAHSILAGGAIVEISAIAIGNALGTSHEIWLNLQRRHDEDLASRGTGKTTS